MRILQVHTRYRQPGGEDVVVETASSALRAVGHDVRDWISQNPSSDLRAMGRLVLSPWNAGAARSIGREIAEFEPDIAHVHNTWYTMSPSVLHALHRESVPVVMTLHNYRLACANAALLRDGEPCQLCVGSHPWHAVRFGCYRGSRLLSIPAALTIELSRLMRTYTETVDTFIALTQRQAETMIEAGLPSERVVVSPHPVEDPGARAESPSDSDLVIFVGRLTEQKGVQLLLESWGDGAPNDLQLIIVGEGPQQDALQSVSGGRIHVLGSMTGSEVGKLMLAARALVFTSVNPEPLGLVALEAMAAGTPVLASSSVGLAPDIERTTGPHWIFESGNRTSLAAALSILADDEACDRAGAASRKLYETRYSGSPAHKLVPIYESLVKGDIGRTPKDSAS